MALIKCPECGRDVSDQATICMNCGYPLSKKISQIQEKKTVNEVKKYEPSNITPDNDKKEFKKIEYNETKKEKKYGYIPLLISAGIGMFYICFSIPYWMNSQTGVNDVFEAIGVGIAATMVLPHLICAILAVIFNVLATLIMKPGFALTGAILYAVSMVLFLPYFMFVIIEMILSFVGFARMKKNKV